MNINAPESPPERARYEHGYFVARQRELQQFQWRVEEGLASYPITLPVVHIWGIRGIGKSWLLQEIQQRYKFAEVPEAGKKDTTCALIDFYRTRFSRWEPLAIANFLESILQSIREQLGEQWNVISKESQAFQTELESMRAAEGDRAASALAEYFVACIKRLGETFVPLLLFDSTEVLSDDDFSWLESHLIEPLSRTDRVIIVVAGRKEIPRWREFGVRQRLKVLELQPFSEEATQEQLKKRGYDQKLGEVVHSLSFGLPYANQILGESLYTLKPTKNFEEVHRAEVLALLGEVEGELLRGIRSEDQRNILRTLSTLRKFNIESARELLVQSLGKKYQGKSDIHYLRLFEDLQDTNLVWWSTGQRGYVVGYPLRRIIDLRMQKGDLPTFRRRHAAAQKFYEVRAKKNPHDCGPTLLEALYHLSNKLVGERPDEMQQEIDRFLAQFLTPENFTTDGADTFLHLLQQDSELQNYRGVMLKPVYEHVVKKIRHLRDQIASVESRESQ
ncbi:MAG: ATP-binding protein [Chloroflexota bacterium]|nr:ATP-binding protein [Chloroflexota bacterium]